MRRMTWDNCLVCLTLVHLGQRLGSETDLARAVSHVIESILCFFARVS
jgi:hypothetical protein